MKTREHHAHDLVQNLTCIIGADPFLLARSAKPKDLDTGYVIGFAILPWARVTAGSPFYVVLDGTSIYERWRSAEIIPTPRTLEQLNDAAHARIAVRAFIDAARYLVSPHVVGGDLYEKFDASWSSITGHALCVVPLQ